MVGIRSRNKARPELCFQKTNLAIAELEREGRNQGNYILIIKVLKVKMTRTSLIHNK